MVRPDTPQDSPEKTPGEGHARIALAHDWLCGVRGGEHVLARIAAVIGGHHECAGLFTMFDDGASYGPELDACPHYVSRIGRLPMATGRLRRWLLPLYPSCVADLSAQLARVHAQRPIDLVVSTSSAAIKGLRTPEGVPHLCYCHTPARYVWSQGGEYAGGLRGLGLKAYGARFRAWDARTAAHVTKFIANSTHTAREVQRCYGRDASVVFPPVRTEFFTPGAARRDHWLVVCALEPYKRVDLAIGAANESGAALTIVGDGSERRRLEALAGPTVKFLGRVSDDALREQYRTARVLVFPQVEDFGIVAVEAQACGLPVVARRAGGALDIVREGVTGAFFDEPTAGALRRAVEACPTPDENACRGNAVRFSEAAFDAAMMREIGALLQRP
jgi:glycosyltransferase involved in cell wall biosynthesis